MELPASDTATLWRHGEQIYVIRSPVENVEDPVHVPLRCSHESIHRENVSIVNGRLRRRWMGPKYGPARGVAVFRSGTDGTNPPEFIEMSQPERLTQWSLEHDLILDGTPESLTALDQRLDAWNQDSSHHERVDLANESGIYLGNVIVSHVPESHWMTWPNGHPLIGLKSGRELDVIALSNVRLHHAGSSLFDIFAASSR